MKDKLIAVWLLSLLCIPLLSFYGRPLQLTIIKQFSTEILTLYLGVTLSVVLVVFLVTLVRSGLDPYCYHLIWVAALSLILYAHLPFVEKIHVALFGMFGFLSQKIFEQKMAVLFCVAVAGLDELLQHFLVARVGDWRDVWLNLFSASLGMLLAFLLFGSRNSQPAWSPDQ
ncbi:MAG: VanZ family protein [Desulfocapsa sp.]|nr:VanZ family protein [Desulfocapsa sp.]